MVGGLYFKQVRRDKDMVIKGIYRKLSRGRRIDMYSKRSLQILKRLDRMLGIENYEQI